MKTTTQKKAIASRIEFNELRQLPNVGPAVAGDLQLLGVLHPKDLIGRDPYKMFDDLCKVTGKRHDPCMLDTFISVVRFMDGGPAKPWWKYTAERKGNGLRASKDKLDSRRPASPTPLLTPAGNFPQIS